MRMCIWLMEKVDDSRDAHVLQHVAWDSPRCTMVVVVMLKTNTRAHVTKQEEISSEPVDCEELGFTPV